MDVLFRLPVKSLVRFRCVSKSWKTLISDEYFKAKHCNHAKNNKKLLIAQMFPDDVGFVHADGETESYKLWVMKEYGVKETWFKLFTIPRFFAIPKYVFVDGEVLFYEGYFPYNGFRTSKGPYELSLSSYDTYLQGFVYTESLISPNLLI
ncbi:hypothetical protein P3S68_005439 [Capsicum galapagoense]